MADKKKESWFSPVLIASYTISKKIKLAARTEYYADKKGIMIYSPSDTPFTSWGFSGNIDFRFLKDCMFRAEYRLLQSPYLVYTGNNGPIKDNRSVAFALIAWFN